MRTSNPAMKAFLKPQTLAGMSVVVTGTLEKFDRKGIEDLIVKLGGKASGSVSKKTSFLVAGESAGSKLDKAKELGVEVISEAEFAEMRSHGPKIRADVEKLLAGLRRDAAGQPPTN